MTIQISRRGALRGAAAAIGAGLSGALFPVMREALAAQLIQGPAPDGAFQEVSDWIWISNRNEIVIGVSQCEVGQGILTGLSEVLADELDADWSKVTVKFVTNRDAYRQVAGGESLQQFVAASTSMTKFYERMRLAGARMRDVFLRAGAARMGVAPDQCTTAASHVSCAALDRKIPYGDLIADLKNFPPLEQPPFKTVYNLVGHTVARVDVPSKVNGSAIFGIDTQPRDMLIATLWVVPSVTGRIRSVRNEAEIRRMSGVVAIVPTRHMSMLNLMGHDPNHDRNALVVVAKSYWQAVKAAERLDVDYEIGDLTHVETKNIRPQAIAMIDEERLVTATSRGEVVPRIAAARADDRQFHEARFESPIIAHATMEPCNGTAYFHDGMVDTWGPFQGQDLVRTAVGKVMKVPPENVLVNNTFLGGSFGRKYLVDPVVHAAIASKVVGKPVKMIYSREVDLRHDYYRPSCFSHFEASVGPDGYPTAFRARYAGPSLYWQMHRHAVEKAGGWDETMVECIYDPVYRMDNLLVQGGIVETPISLSFLRGVGSISSVFFLESFLNELAAKAGIDEFTYRQTLLSAQPDAMRVLSAATDAAGWSQPAPAGRHRGLAFNRWVGRNHAFTTYIALVAEVSVAQGRARVHRIVCAIDCGKVINASLIRANVEGGIGFALTGAFYSEITFADGAAEQGNFDRYPLLAMSEMPDIEVVIVETDRPPQGCGEISTAVVAPAVASALRKATGRTFRRLPFDIQTQRF